MAVIINQVHNYKNIHGNSATWRYTLRQCTTCGLGFISPKPTFEVLQTFYDLDYGCYAVTMNLGREANSLKYKLAKLRYASIFRSNLRNGTAATLGSVAEWLTGKVLSYTIGLPLNLACDARILEVGYGSGSWLLIMEKLGYSNLHGYDIDANSENRNRLTANGIKVQCGDLLQVAYPDDYFDCIRLEHSFEHLLNPGSILNELYRILKPGGHLVMNFPSINASSFNLSPLHYAHRDSPRHLYLHTRLSASNMLRAANFTVRGIREYGVALVLGATINNSLKARGFAVGLKGFSVFSPIYHLIEFFARRGEAITLWASK